MDLTCPSCGKAFPEGASFCPACGAPRESSVAAAGPPGTPGPPSPPAPGEPKKKMETWMIVLIVCVAAGGVCFCLPVVAAIAIPNLLAAKLSSNETAAIATLRNMASCQAQVQTSGKIDADGDGIGEYGTFMELTGSVGVRKGFRPGSAAEEASADFEEAGDRVNPPILSVVLARVDAAGVATKSGFCFVIYLPDSSKAGGWTREANSGAPGGHMPGLTGGTGRVGVDASEIRWCAYAWPMAQGNSGNRAFYVDYRGDVFQSDNAGTRYSGAASPPQPDAAFAPGKDAPVPGASGNDGDVWTVTN